MAEKQIQSVSWWHQSLIDWMVANPDSTLGEAARFFGKSQSWLSVVIRSDVFQAAFAERLQGHRTLMSRDISERLQDLTHVVLEEFERRMLEEMNTITFQQLLDGSELVLKAQGFTARSGGALNIRASGPVQVNNNFGTVDPAVYAQARQTAQRVEAQKLRESEPKKMELLPVPAAP